MSKYDDMMKRLGRLRPQDFIRWFCPQIKEIESITFEDREFEWTHRRVDLLYHVKTKELGEFYLELEFETSNHADFPYRMLEYFSRIWKAVELPLKPVAIFLNVTESIRKIPHEIQCKIGKEVICSFRYEKILLPEEPWQKVLSNKLPALLPLVSLSQIPKGEEELALKQTVEELEKIEDKALRSELLAIFYLLGSYKYQALLKTLLGAKLMEDLMESPAYREAVEFGERKGELKGEVKGEQKSIQKFLEARFQKLPSVLLEELSQIQNLEKLEYLVKQAAVVKTLSEFQLALTQLLKDPQ
jgi:predicted transposase YdaD